MTEIQVLRHYTTKSIIRTKYVLFYDRDIGIETSSSPNKVRSVSQVLFYDRDIGIETDQ